MARWIRRIALGMVGLAALALTIGAVSEAVIRHQVSREFPVAGRLIDIGGRNIQLDCRGTGSPTVVLEAGLDLLGSLSWAAVHDSLATTTRVCAYSRAGILWSDPSDQPFNASTVAADLHLTLEKAGERAPFVLVAHSIGGLYAMKFTENFSTDVVGLVLVDASHPDQVARLEAASGATMMPPSGPVSVAARLSRTGILRFLPATSDPSAAPTAVHDAAGAYLPVSLNGLAPELRGLSMTFADTRPFRQLGDRPVVVLTAGAPTPQETLTEMAMTKEQGERMRAEWIALQQERTQLWSNGRHELVNDAGHYVQFDRPDVVVRAVREVIGAIGAPR